LALQAGFLKAGDYLIVDNACVHGGAETIEVLLEILKQVGVQLIFLPKYSPELNPCELVFNVMKNFLRYKRNRQNPIWIEALKALALIKTPQIAQFFYKCLSLEEIKDKVDLFT